LGRRPVAVVQNTFTNKEYIEQHNWQKQYIEQHRSRIISFILCGDLNINYIGSNNKKTQLDNLLST
jgi:hypothetical protein